MIRGKPPNSLRIVAWNANGAVHRKLTALERLHPDIAIISECANESVLRTKAGSLMDSVSSMTWMGNDPNKGLAVLAFGSYELEPV
jgi:hypothetical protein